MYAIEKVVQECLTNYTLKITEFKQKLSSMRFNNKEKAKILKEILKNPNLLNLYTYRILFNRIMRGNPKRTRLLNKGDSKYILRDLKELDLITYNNQKIKLKIL